MFRSYFYAGKIKAVSMSLSVLVVIEMFNAMNALSEDSSLLQMPPWCNPWLLLAIALSTGVHMMIMYVPWMATLFQITALDVQVCTAVPSPPPPEVDSVWPEVWGRWSANADDGRPLGAYLAPAHIFFICPSSTGKTTWPQGHADEVQVLDPAPHLRTPCTCFPVDAAPERERDCA